MRQFGIIGLGSIGRRHARILKLLANDAVICAHRTRRGALLEPASSVIELSEESFFSAHFDLVVISNPSSMHLDSLRRVLSSGIAQIVLVEKPFCTSIDAPAALQLLADFPKATVLPGNCLRFHPAVAQLKTVINAGSLGQVLECHAHFGTYMPGWHPYEDYRSTYAARKELGGGVLLTSIHEIDLMHHLFGKGRVVGAISTNISLKEIDVEDTAHVLLTLERCKVANLSLNFFERPADRYLKVVFEGGTFLWRFGDSAVRVARWDKGGLQEVVVEVDATVDSMYANMWKCVLAGEFADFEFASVVESLNTVSVSHDIGKIPLWN